MMHASLHATAVCSRADVGPAPHVPYLPPEVHHIIAPHMDYADLPNYRLVSKSCAEIGTFELFRTIAFHCSSASMARVEAIKACEHLNKHVHTLIWDSNMWTIPSVGDYNEWVAYFKRKADLQDRHLPNRHFLPPWDVQPRQLLELANSHSDWERYLNFVQDERRAKSILNIRRFFGGFKSLEKLRVLNGGLTTTSRGVEKTSLYTHAPKSTGPWAYYRGESLHNDDADICHRPGSWAYAAVIENIEWNLTKLRMDAMHWSAIGWTSDSPCLHQLLSLHLTISFEADPRRAVRNSDLDHMFAQRTFSRHFVMEFLASLPKLQSLKLDFGRRLERSNEWLDYAAPISDLFSEHHTWPDLRKLSLEGVDSTCDAFLSLLESHRSTLRVLKLHDLWFNPQVSRVSLLAKLPEVVVRMHSILDLERVKWTGYLGRSPDATGGKSIADGVGWNLSDDSIVPSVAEYLVKGGVCPLNDSNMIGRDSTMSP